MARTRGEYLLVFDGFSIVVIRASYGESHPVTPILRELRQVDTIEAPYRFITALRDVIRTQQHKGLIVRLKSGGYLRFYPADPLGQQGMIADFVQNNEYILSLPGGRHRLKTARFQHFFNQ